MTGINHHLGLFVFPGTVIVINGGVNLYKIPVSKKINEWKKNLHMARATLWSTYLGSFLVFLGRKMLKTFRTVCPVLVVCGVGGSTVVPKIGRQCWKNVC
jgi:hypothetical protein